MAAIWSTNKIMPISIALDTPFESSEKFLSKSSPSNSDSSSEEQKSLSVSSEKLVKTQVDTKLNTQKVHQPIVRIKGNLYHTQT